MSVIGPAEKVDECIDFLLNMEEEILQEMADRDDESGPVRFRAENQNQNKPKPKKSGGVS